MSFCQSQCCLVLFFTCKDWYFLYNSFRLCYQSFFSLLTSFSNMKEANRLSHDAILILDNQDHIIGINSAGEKLLQRNIADLQGRSASILFPRQATGEYLKEILKDGVKEINLKFRNRKSFKAKLVVSTILTKEGEISKRVLAIRDLNQNQEKITIKQKRDILKKQNDILRALHETTLDLHASLELKIVLQRIVERACQLLDTTHGYLDILSENNDLIPMIGMGALKESLNHKVTKGDGVAGVVWKTGKPIIINDYDTWPGRIANFPNNTIRATVGIPLLLDKMVIGVIGIAKGAENDTPITDEDIIVLSRFADMASIAFHNAKLYENAQKEIDFRKSTEIQLRNANQILQLQIEQVEQLQKRLEELAIRDPLTELFNRRYLDGSLTNILKEAKEADQTLAILMIDSDHLKTVNDQFGHKAGDDFLIQIANVLKDNIRNGDIACRYGGDEYVVIMKDVSPECALARGESLRENVYQIQAQYRRKDVKISVSIGISMFPLHGEGGEELLQKADLALYEAKRKGKNCVVSYQ